MHRQHFTLIGAATATAIGIAMAAAGSIERAGSPVDVALVVAMSVMVTAAAHLLPALVRSLASRVLWLACITLTIYSHAAFFTAAAHRAGSIRADAVQTDTRTAALRDQLAALPAQSAAAAADALAATRSRAAALGAALARCEARTPGRCTSASAAAAGAIARAEAAAIALQAAQHADTLRAQLTSAAGTLDDRRTAAATDPVSAQLGAITGLQPDTLQTAVSVLGAVVVDLLGALLWSQSLSPMEITANATKSHHAPIATTHQSHAPGNGRLRQASLDVADEHDRAEPTVDRYAADQLADQAPGRLRSRLPAALRSMLARTPGRSSPAGRLATAINPPPTSPGWLRAAPVPPDSDPRLDRHHAAPHEDPDAARPPPTRDGGDIRAIAAAAQRAARAMRSPV